VVEKQAKGGSAARGILEAMTEVIFPLLPTSMGDKGDSMIGTDVPRQVASEDADARMKAALEPVVGAGEHKDNMDEYMRVPKTAIPALPPSTVVPNIVSSTAQSASSNRKVAGDTSYDLKSPPHAMHRAKAPINEFREYGLILLLTFVNLFPLGEGLQMDSGTANQDEIKHWLRQYDRRFCRNPYFLMFLYDTKRRHALAREVKCSIINNPAGFEEVKEVIFDPGFKDSMITAIKHPETEDAHKLVSLLNKLVVITTSKIDYTPAASTKALKTILSQMFYFGLPSSFTTIAPDYLYNIASVRLSLLDSRLTKPTLPSSDLHGAGELRELMKLPDADRRELGLNLSAVSVLDPVAQCVCFYKSIGNFVTQMLGIAPSSGSRKTMLPTHRRAGCLGKTYNCI
jgi:hypothetical protein